MKNNCSRFVVLCCCLCSACATSAKHPTVCSKSACRRPQYLWTQFYIYQ